ncbi:MAG: hypothetical protein PQJ58_19525 [Spirochaetales bacterium]|nr:hypothetical protein [Spirochaetales bacterium]
MKKNLGKLALVLMVLFVSAGLMSCDAFKDEESLSVLGTWGNGTMEITSDTYSVDMGGSWGEWNYSADIISFDNSSWNAGEEGEGSYGYMVLKFTSHSDDDTAAATVGKYTVFRWKNLTTVDGVTAMETSEGYGDYYDNADDALENITAANGYFNFYSATVLDE